MDPIDEAIASSGILDTFDPDAAAPEGDAAPPASNAEAPESETVDAAPETETDPAADLAALQDRLAALQQERDQAAAEAAAIRQQQAQAKAQAEAYLHQVALERAKTRLAELPDLDPAEQRQAVDEWTSLVTQPLQRQAQGAQEQAERAYAYITMQHLASAYGLDEAEQQTLSGMYAYGPQAMEQYAKSVSAAKQTTAAELDQVRKQLNDLQLQLAANGRREAGADAALPTTGHASAADLDRLSGDAWMDAWFAQAFPVRHG